MASSIDKHKKSNKDTTSSSMYVYKFGGIGSRTPEYYASAAAAAKKSKGWGHILRRSSKNSKKDTLHHEGVQEKDIKEVVVEASGIKLAHDSGFFDQGRKSLSSLDVKLGRNYVEGGKSVSHQQIPGKNYNNDSNNNNNNNNNTKAGVGGMRKKSVHEDDHHRRHHVPENHEGKLKPSSISTHHVDRILSSLSKSSDDVLGRKYAEGRRSVSHVEDNRAYVGSRYTDAVADRDHEGSKGGRKSVSGVEGLKSEIGLLQVRVLVTDMPAFMQIHAFRCARRTFDSLETFSAKHMAYNLKKEFDKVYGPAWHCIVGSSFGSFVTHSTGCFLYFSMEKLYILLFKTKVQKALE